MDFDLVVMEDFMVGIHLFLNGAWLLVALHPAGVVQVVALWANPITVLFHPKKSNNHSSFQISYI